MCSLPQGWPNCWKWRFRRNVSRPSKVPSNCPQAELYERKVGNPFVGYTMYSHKRRMYCPPSWVAETTLQNRFKRNQRLDLETIAKAPTGPIPIKGRDAIISPAAWYAVATGLYTALASPFIAPWLKLIFSHFEGLLISSLNLHQLNSRQTTVAIDSIEAYHYLIDMACTALALPHSLLDSQSWDVGDFEGILIRSLSFPKSNS